MMINFNNTLITFLCFALLFSCEIDNSTDSVFEESSALERRNNRINEISDLLQSTKWVAEYQAADNATGFYRMIMTFTEDEVTIEADFAGNNGEFYDFTSQYEVNFSAEPQLVFTTGNFHKYLFDYIVEDTRDKVVDFEFGFNETSNDLIELKGLQYNSEMSLVPLTDNLKEELERSRSTSEDLLSVSGIGLQIRYPDDDLVYLNLDENYRKVLFQGGENSNDQFEDNSNYGYRLRDNKIVFDEPYEYTLDGNDDIIEEIIIKNITLTPNQFCGITSNAVLIEATLLPGNIDVIIENSSNTDASFLNLNNITGLFTLVFRGGTQQIFNSNGDLDLLGFDDAFNSIPDQTFSSFQLYWDMFDPPYNNRVYVRASSSNGSIFHGKVINDFVVNSSNNTITFVNDSTRNIWTNHTPQNLTNDLDNIYKRYEFFNTPWYVEFRTSQNLDGDPTNIYYLTNTKTCVKIEMFAYLNP